MSRQVSGTSEGGADLRVVARMKRSIAATIAAASSADGEGAIVVGRPLR